MSGISHKQAMKWINHRLDGLITQSQALQLDEHLDSCDTCRAYAAEITSLPAHLQDKFRARWDHQLGPSQKVRELVTAKARRFPLRRRVSAGVKVMTSASALLVLAFLVNLVVSQLHDTSTSASETETANNSALPENRLLAFTSGKNGNAEIYTMHPDGSGLTNITNHPAYDGYPFWSPDGKQIAFMSDRDGSPQIYLMEADGSNMIQLTEGEGKYNLDVNRYTPWSPDGRKLIYSYRPPEETRWNLYALDIDKKTSTALTSEPGEYILPSWSPDGRHIAFTAESDRASNTRDLFIVSSDGSNLVRLTENISAGEIFLFGDYSWSHDGMSITFSTHSYGPVGQSSAYEAGLDGSLTVLARTDKFMIDWWNGTTLQEDSEAKTLTWLRSDSSQSTLNLCQSGDSLQGIAYKRSNDGNLVFGSSCSNRGWMLYWANPDGTIVNELLGSPIPANGNTDHIFNMTWSPDDRYLVFVALHTDANSDGSTTLYIVDIAKARDDPSLQPLKMTNSSGPSWQPVIHETLVKEEPTPEPPDASGTQSLIAFTAAGENGNSDVFTVRADGSELVNLTNSPARESILAWSPDGTRLAFVSDRDGNENIYVINADGSNLIRITDDPRTETSPLWSPDGERIAYTLYDPDENTANLYLIDASGENQHRLTDRHTSADTIWAWAGEWGMDGEHIFYIDQQINKVNVESGEITPVTPDMDFPSYLSLNKGDSKIIYLSDCNGGSVEFCSKSKTIREDGTGEETNKTMELQQVCTSAGAPPNKVHSFYYMAKWSPDRTKILFAFNCFEYGELFYVANADGSNFKPLTTYPIPTGYPGLNQDIDFDWSPDSQSIVFPSSSDGPQTQDLYLLNVDHALQNSELRPTRLNVSTSQASNLAWQPVHIRNVTETALQMKIDPQSCKPASELASDLQPPNNLSGYDLVQGTSFVDGDFSYEVWLYCDPSIQPDEQRNLNTIAGLGIFASWKYTGPPQEGHTEYYFAFEQDSLVQGGSWDGPIYNASLTRARFGIHLPKFTIQESIRQGIPIPFYAVIYSPLGQKSATFSFHLEPSENGLKVVDLQASPKVLTSRPTQSPSSEVLPPIGTGVSNGEWIAFIGGEMIPNPADLTAPTLNYHVYMIHPDGSGLTNLTQFAAHYPDLQWSPNGQSLLFMRENPDRNNVTILRHFPGLETGYLEVAPPIVDPDHSGFSWSPNSDKIVFTDASSGNYDIYTAYADGRNDTKLTRLTDDPAQDVGFAWSPDGSQIAFQRLDGERLSVYIMNEDGSDQREVAHGSGQVKLQWSHDGRSIYASSIENNWLECEGCVAKPAIYRIQLHGPSVHQIYYEEETSNFAGWYVYDTPQNMLYFLRGDHPNFVEFWGTWFRADGNSVTEIGELDPQQTCSTTAGNVLNESISPNPRFSVISNFCAGAFDLYLADREATTPEKRFIHLLQLPLDTSGQGGDSATLPMGWSPDGRWLIYENAANTTSYLLNIEKAIQEPTTQPIVLIRPEYYTDPSGQVFQSSETVSLSGLMWQPQP